MLLIVDNEQKDVQGPLTDRENNLKKTFHCCEISLGILSTDRLHIAGLIRPRHSEARVTGGEKVRSEKPYTGR